METTRASIHVVTNEEGLFEFALELEQCPSNVDVRVYGSDELERAVRGAAVDERAVLVIDFDADAESVDGALHIASALEGEVPVLAVAPYALFGAVQARAQGRVTRLLVRGEDPLESIRLALSTALSYVRVDTVPPTEGRDSGIRCALAQTADYAYCLRISGCGEPSVVWVSEAFEGLTGFSLADLEPVGGWSRVVHPDDLLTVCRELHCLPTGVPTRQRFRVRSRDGAVRWLKGRAWSHADPDDFGVRYVYGAGIDATEERVNADRLRDRVELGELIIEAAAHLVGRGPEGLSEVLGLLGARLGVDRMFAAFVDDGARQVTRVVEWTSSGTNRAFDDTSSIWTLAYPAWRDRLVSGKAIRVADAGEFGSAGQSLAFRSAESTVMVPVRRIDGTPVAFLAADTMDRRVWGDEEVDALGTFAALVRAEMDTDAAVSVLRQRNSELDALHRVSRAALQSIAAGDRIDTVAHSIAETAGFDAAAIELHERERGRLNLCGLWGDLFDEDEVPHTAAVGQSLSGDVVRTAVPQVVVGSASCKGAAGASRWPSEVACAVSVPMFVDGEVIGALTLFSRTPLDVPAERVVHVQTLANYVALVAKGKRAERDREVHEERFRQLAESIHQVFWLYSIETDEVLYLSPAFEELTGRPVQEVYDDPGCLADLIHPEDRAELVTRLLALGKGDEVDAEFRLVTKEGASRVVRGQAFPVRNEEGQVVRIAGIGEDITRLRESEENLLRAVMFDPLTELPNRTLLMQYLKRVVDRAGRHPERRYGVLLVDIDHFKNVNDGLGHARGDEILREVGERLKSCVRDVDTVARLGGDEYGVLLDEVAHESDATRVAERILAQFDKPFAVGDDGFTLRASIGIVTASDEYKEAEHALRDADTALNRAKAGGRSRYEIFDRQMHRRAVNLLRLENDLRRGLERGEFQLYYQPLVDLTRGDIVGFEALIRWERPGFGMTYPETFIHTAEETGIIVDMGWWAMREACRQAAEWNRGRAEGAPPLRISVNLSARQFLQPNLAERVEALLREYKLHPGTIRLEVTESRLMEDSFQASRNIERLRGLDVQISIDDFGTGYSSLRRLQDLPIDALKIDRSFVAEMERGDRERAFVTTIVNFAKCVGVAVTAEGIETDEQMAILREIGCDYGQGYLFSRPVPAVEAKSLLDMPPMGRA